MPGYPGPASGTPIWRGVHLTVRVDWGKFCWVGASGCLCARDRGQAGGRAGAERAERARSYKLYCDALTTTDGPCQTSPDLLPSALSAEQWGQSGELGQLPAVAASVHTPMPQAQGLIPGTRESESSEGSGLLSPVGCEQSPGNRPQKRSLSQNLSVFQHQPHKSSILSQCF